VKRVAIPIAGGEHEYTTGGFKELIDRIIWMRRLRGNTTYPIARLATQFMRTKWAGRLRPHFEIVDWTKFDLDSGGAIPVSETQQLPKPTEQLPQQPVERDACTDHEHDLSRNAEAHCAPHE
jgi:hypothetical protein